MGRPYSNNEHAVISASGPGRIDVTAFNTEVGYDKLSISDSADEHSLSGDMPQTTPYSIDLSNGSVSIAWSSDSSNAASGWSFKLHQEGRIAELRVEAAEVLGSGFEVVSAYGENELTSAAVSVEFLK